MTHTYYVHGHNDTYLLCKIKTVVHGDVIACRTEAGSNRGHYDVPVCEELLHGFFGRSYLGLQIASGFRGQLQMLFCTLYDLLVQVLLLWLCSNVLQLPQTSLPLVYLHGSAVLLTNPTQVRHGFHHCDLRDQLPPQRAEGTVCCSP